MIRVHIGENYLTDGIKIAIVRTSQDGQPEHIWRPGDSIHTAHWDDIEPHIDTDPSLTLPGDTARALLDALTRHYHGADDTRALRADYDKALQRADLQAGVIADVARTLAAKVGTS